MLYKILNNLHQYCHFDSAAAHCDIPCKIYDPISAQLAALSVLRFLDLIGDLEQQASLSLEEQAKRMRLVNEKETHAAKVKEEVRIIWGDFFKQVQIDQQPDIHTLVHNIMLSASACKQSIKRENGEQLLDLVNQFAGSFWRAKNIKTYRSICPYPPSEELVYPLLERK